MTTGGRHRGLTLVELMVVLAIAAVLVSLAVPEVGRQLARWKLQAAAEHLAADLNDARHDAPRLGMALQLRVEPGHAWCWSVSAAPACPCESAQPCQRRRASAAQFPSVSIADGTIASFAPTADARAAAVRVALSSSYGDRLQVLVSPLGRARICSPESASATYPRC
jgi:type IV fimbrial biogenesis protein FimT